MEVSIYLSIYLSIIIIIIILLLARFSHQRFTGGLSLESEWERVSEILAHLNNAVIWTVSILPIISNS